MSKSKGKRYTEKQIIAILNEVGSGKSVSQVCRDKGVSEQTVYRWKQRYGGMNIDELKKMKALEEENQRRGSASSSNSPPWNRSSIRPWRINTRA